jgi:hypothetical protein
MKLLLHRSNLPNPRPSIFGFLSSCNKNARKTSPNCKWHFFLQSTPQSQLCSFQHSSLITLLLMHESEIQPLVPFIGCRIPVIFSLLIASFCQLNPFFHSSWIARDEFKCGLPQWSWHSISSPSVGSASHSKTSWKRIKEWLKCWWWWGACCLCDRAVHRRSGRC